ncbi:hypothetical protein C0Q70_07754 [Pomacea canaliculata]|uniref:Leucine-rich repeat-containing protein 57 n=1 Tax=Pomacea canaliculata TaxID=400727 RepID=A0A2T7PFY6_POMCA|nr:hypothetical protein C0Q70_07754 [Pomacea canaliculata]
MYIVKILIGTRGLDLVNFVPEDLQRLKNSLRTLDLSFNKIPELPPWIVQFTSLKNLSVSHNKITSLPVDIGNLKKLEVLNADHNLLTSVPRSIANITNLKTLNLSGNRLHAFPLELCNLRNLDVVDLSSNAIMELPGNIGGLQAVELNLNQNQVSRLPESLADCPRLKVLRLEENCLDVTAFTPRIMRDSQISLFAVEGNVFDMKTFHNVEGYEAYMERFTATKKKFN